MICETPKERIGFLVSSLVTLADMSGSDLRDLTEIVGVDTIQGLLDMEPLPFELSFQEMAGEICAYIEWEPSLSAPCLDVCKVDRLGNQIAGMASTLPPAKELQRNDFSQYCARMRYERWSRIAMRMTRMGLTGFDSTDSIADIFKRSLDDRCR